MGKLCCALIFSAVVLCARSEDAGLASIDDVRVDALAGTHWGQRTDTGYNNTGNPCFNYFTPNGYPCGCNAISLSQLCRYWRFPYSIPKGTSRCLIDGVESTLEFGGEAYAYDDMPLLAAGAAEAERRAIGRLVGDCAVALHSMFAEGNTFAFGMFSFVQLREVFGYADAVGYVPQESCSATPELANTIIANLDAKCPVMMTITASANGNTHQALIDGYGYHGGKLYFHFNMGWCNVRGDDAWYELDGAVGHSGTDTYRFDLIDGLVYNVFPAENGDVLSGRVLDAGGNPVVDAAVEVTRDGKTVATGRTDGKGIYAFVLEGGKTYGVSSSGRSISVALPASVCAKRRITTTRDGDIWEDPFRPAYNVEGVLGGSSGNDIRLADTPDTPDVPGGELGPFNPLKAGKGEYPYGGAVCDESGNPCGTMTVKFTKPTKKGVSKVSASIKLLDGKTYSLTATPVEVSEVSSAIVADKAIKKLGTLARLEIGAEGFTAEFVRNDGSRLVAATSDLSVGLAPGVHAFRVSGIPLEIGGFPVIDDLLPDGAEVTVNGKGKIAMPKATTVKYGKVKGTRPAVYELVIDTSRGKTNLSGLKLTYTAKTSSIKGSFYVYTDDSLKHKVKKIMFSVKGMVIDGRVFATAACKKPALSLPVTVE